MSTFIARYPGRCGACGGQILPGVDEVGENRDGVLVHVDCYAVEDDEIYQDLPEQITEEPT